MRIQRSSPLLAGSEKQAPLVLSVRNAQATNSAQRLSLGRCQWGRTTRRSACHFQLFGKWFYVLFDELQQVAIFTGAVRVCAGMSIWFVRRASVRHSIYCSAEVWQLLVCLKLNAV